MPQSLYFHCLGWIDSFDLGRPMQLSYIENIPKIGGPNQAVLYKAQLESLDRKLEILNNLHRANIHFIVEIKVARAHSELVFLQEKLKKMEEAWACKIN